jgi:long-subunit acyl-CoA synthetase (AMP-forming)
MWGVGCGGASLKPAARKDILAAGIKIAKYAVTEHTYITINRTFQRGKLDRGTVIGDVEVKIAEDGEIRAAAKMMRYFNDPELTRSAIDIDDGSYGDKVGKNNFLS